MAARPKTHDEIQAAQTIADHNPEAAQQARTDLDVKVSEIRSNHAEITGHEGRAQDSLYQMLAKTVGFVRMTQTKEGALRFKAMCADATPRVDPNSNTDINKNRFIPHIRFLFQDPKGVLPSAAYKWGQAVRYLIENNIDEGEVVETINTFTHKKKTKFVGLVAADTANHPTNRGSSDATEDKIYKIKRKCEDVELAEFEPETAPPTAAKMCLVLGELDKSGRVILRQFYDGDDLDKLVAKFAPKKEKKSKFEEMAEEVE
ncbi:hypothetical protein DF3PA_70142 [Candidatus Defluviicoccus seviourii]|uniref:Uncharacterized protein n=1 Tax=Candidatus Defluviicoccus seviourii TaxID=2565273 RepID=A0A564WHN2_9PROT|nr:hypothetical protein DF3PA_70142 [Candidatus Defluviicoccus seviourii]